MKILERVIDHRSYFGVFRINFEQVSWMSWTSFISVFIDISEHVVVLGRNLKVTVITKSNKQNQRAKKKTVSMMEIIF